MEITTGIPSRSSLSRQNRWAPLRAIDRAVSMPATGNSTAIANSAAGRNNAARAISATSLAVHSSKYQLMSRRYAVAMCTTMTPVMTATRRLSIHA
jgi:hypothetical protein